MSEIVKYEHTSEFARKVSREFLLRRFGVIFGVLLLALLYLIFLSEINKGFLWGLAILSVAIAVVYALFSEKSAAEKAKLLPNPIVSITFNDEGITTDNLGHVSTLKWQKLRGIMKLKSAWVFIFHNENFYIAIPAEVMSHSAKAFIEKKVSEDHKLIQ
jgi:hypothetical protein